MKRINTTQRSPGIQIAVLLLLLSSCTSGEQETGIGRPLEVTAEIAAPVTRATDAHESDYDKRTFVANDQINIYSGASASGSATVYKYSDSYIGIIRANAGAVYQITVSAGGIDKSYAQSSIKLEAANNYIYNFTSTNKLILNSVNVTPFASDGSAESGGDLNAT